MQKIEPGLSSQNWRTKSQVRVHSTYRDWHKIEDRRAEWEEPLLIVITQDAVDSQVRVALCRVMYCRLDFKMKIYQALLLLEWEKQGLERLWGFRVKRQSLTSKSKKTRQVWGCSEHSWKRNYLSSEELSSRVWHLKQHLNMCCCRECQQRCFIKR